MDHDSGIVAITFSYLVHGWSVCLQKPRLCSPVPTCYFPRSKQKIALNKIPQFWSRIHAFMACQCQPDIMPKHNYNSITRNNYIARSNHLLFWLHQMNYCSQYLGRSQKTATPSIFCLNYHYFSADEASTLLDARLDASSSS